MTQLIDLESLDATLRDALEAAGEEPIVFTQDGQPLYILRSLIDDDVTDDLIALNPDFLESIRRARQQKVQGRTRTLAEIRAAYAQHNGEME